MPRKSNTDVLALFDTLVYTCQYRLVLEPASHVSARVLEWRQGLRERIGLFHESYHIPGIILCSTELPPEYERSLVDAIAHGSEGFASFNMNIGGVQHSEDKRTIYLEVGEKGIIAALRQRVVDHVRTNRRIKKLGVEVVDHARLVIASGLKADQFNAAWAMLAVQSVMVQQKVSDVVLIKRELGDTSMDEHVRTFALTQGV